MSKISRWYFIALLIMVLGAGVALALTVPFMHRFESPDTALAWIALLLAILLVIQQGTNYLQGFVYMLMGKADRNTVDNSPQNKNVNKPIIARGRWGVVLKSGYWISIILLLLVSTSLFIGTIREPSETAIEELIESNKGLIKPIEDLTKSNKDLIDRIDKVIEQNSEMLKRLEVQNVSGNDATTKQP